MTAIKQIEDALKAGPTDGPWYGHFDSVRTSNLPQHRRDISRCIVDVTCTRGKSEREQINSLYIAVCNPANMREVLAHIKVQDAEITRLRKALQMLHDDVADYQRINKLGGYDNHCMKLARVTLATTPKGAA